MKAKFFFINENLYYFNRSKFRRIKLTRNLWINYKRKEFYGIKLFDSKTIKLRRNFKKNFFDF